MARRAEADGRVYRPVIVARSRSLSDGRVEVLSPSPGLWRGAPAAGALVRADTSIGEIEMLGMLHELRVDGAAHGVVVDLSERGVAARRVVQHGQVLLTLDPTGLSAHAALEADAREHESGLSFTAPSSGRFYLRPAPDKPPFVQVGGTVRDGDVVALLEVMKTFHRISYGGPGLPRSARVLAIVPQDGDDVEVGQALLSLEALSDG